VQLLGTFDETRQCDNLEAPVWWAKTSQWSTQQLPYSFLPNVIAEIPSHPEAGNVYLAAEVNLIAESLFEKGSNVVNRVLPFVFGTSDPSSFEESSTEKD